MGGPDGPREAENGGLGASGPVPASGPGVSRVRWWALDGWDPGGGVGLGGRLVDRLEPDGFDWGDPSDARGLCAEIAAGLWQLQPDAPQAGTAPPPSQPDPPPAVSRAGQPLNPPSRQAAMWLGAFQSPTFL
jgi:hypothetical protein